PGHLAQFDVGIIPFARSPLTEAAQPLKLWEYLAAGLPVVASRLASLDPAPGHVTLAETAAEWLAGLDAAVVPAARGEGRVRERRTMAADHSWDATLRIVLAALGNLGETSAHDESRRQLRP